MAAPTVYIKCSRNIEVTQPDVYLRDLGQLRCADSTVSARLKSLRVHHFGAKEPKRCVISVLKLVELAENEYPNITIEIVGEVDVLVELVEKKKGSVGLWAKAVLVCLVVFFGTAYTIMAYHNDAGIHDIFREMYRVCLGEVPQKAGVLEISYSIGLALGIILFFNHVGGRRITKDPTPIEVAMRNYERDVNTALVETAGREGKEIDG